MASADSEVAEQSGVWSFVKPTGSKKTKKKDKKNKQKKDKAERKRGRTSDSTQDTEDTNTVIVNAHNVMKELSNSDNVKAPFDHAIMEESASQVAREEHGNKMDWSAGMGSSFFTARSRRSSSRSSAFSVGSAVMWPIRRISSAVGLGPKRPTLNQEKSLLISALFDGSDNDNNNVPRASFHNSGVSDKTDCSRRGKRSSILRYRKKLSAEMEDDDLTDFRYSQQTTSIPSSLLSSNRGVSISNLQESLELSKSTSFKVAFEGVDGGDAWRKIIKPFVSDLAFESIVTRRAESAVCFDPYTCEAAVLFVDLSGYSKITSAIAHRGAHAMSSVVNAYLDRLLKIIDRYGGDVIKFAGDAVLVVWAGQEGDDDELEYNLLCASKCALELQRQAGSHPVKRTNHKFQIHCGLCCGIMESEIFAAPTHIHMQRLFHSVSGKCLSEISELVDLAKAGQIAISEDVADYLGTRGHFEEIRGVIGAMLLSDLELDNMLLEAMDQHILDSKAARSLKRIKGSEEDFIHPNVLRLLKYGGLSPTNIAQMRNLCVLFIGMTSSGNSVNWLMEVQGVLDRYRCPIIQIIDDDKGTHVVAAVNLCESVPESAVLGLDACRELVNKQIGCAIGVAMGSTFCGVTGSSDIACRWDITGPHPVRAARLMQYALLNGFEVAIDESLLEDPMAATRMTTLDTVVEIKGSPEPCTVYGLSGSKLYSVFRVMENHAERVHNRAVHQVRKCINTGRTRCGVILTGSLFAGKKAVCQQAASLSDLVPFTHVCNETAGLAQLARTIAVWFAYVENESIKKQALSVLDHMDNSRWSKAHDECVDLVHAAVDAGLRACFVVDRIQFLDSFSLSVMRGCLEGKSNARGEGCSTGSSIQRVGNGESNDSGSDWSRGSFKGASSYRKGKVVFLGCHLALYNRKSAEEMKDDITRSRRTFRVRVVEVGQCSNAELKTLVREKCDLEADERWLRCHKGASGVSMAYFWERAKATRRQSASDAFRMGRDEVTKGLKLNIPTGHIQHCQHFPLSEISADFAMKTLQLFDDLPPLFQTLTKVIAIATRKAGFMIPSMIVWKVMNDLYGDLDSARFATVIGELKDMYLLKIVVDRNMDKVYFACPILAEVAMSVCTPSQIRVISEALVKRLESMVAHEFRVPLVLADLYHELGRSANRQKKCYYAAYKAFIKEHGEDPHASPLEKDWWLEYFSDVVQLAGYSTAQVLGPTFVAPVISEAAAPDDIMRLKQYIAPVTFGPLGQTLSAIGRTIVQEYGAHARDDGAAQLKHAEELAAICNRYLQQVGTMEDYLGEEGMQATESELEEERNLLQYLASPGTSEEHVLSKSERFQNALLADHVSPRWERIRDYMSCVVGTPEPVTSCKDSAIGLAYEKTVRGKCWKDKLEDALMAMAVSNWKPRPVPECKSLPLPYLQTICKVRDTFLMQTSDMGQSDLEHFHHRYKFSDFQAFLIMTALLYNAMDQQIGAPPRPLLTRQNSVGSDLSLTKEEDTDFESDGDS
ncbi:cyclase type 10 [Seminavis robusta]|uniref:Cyclase type 10 n=1 Tax=Seminavis robusta TaxID=568900 RepID=A0A9N8DZY0_9STRA|nr:cyclase type 10 [Seminavis robusta]|eukprot:Sro512_g157710.1 cyclase type 10 (1506) ;mRNA; f:49699-54395